MLIKFGKSFIAIDGTHGLNSYDFELMTVLVKDEFGNGFCTAFLFSNRKDTYFNLPIFLNTCLCWYYMYSQMFSYQA